MNENDTTALQIDWVRLAWNSGRSYSQLESDQDKANYILNFDEDVKMFERDVLAVKELQDAFAVGANGLPFSEVKKG
jgi:urease accessory protein UreE